MKFDSIKGKKVYKSISLPNSTIDKIRNIAEANNTSFNNVVANMIKKYLDDHPDKKA